MACGVLPAGAVSPADGSSVPATLRRVGAMAEGLVSFGGLWGTDFEGRVEGREVRGGGATASSSSAHQWWSQREAGRGRAVCMPASVPVGAIYRPAKERISTGGEGG